MPLSTGDDVEDALSIIEANGGGGEYETADDLVEGSPDVQRWLFPRFAGATDNADMYLSRSGLGPYDTDVETMMAWLAAPRNRVGGVLVIGPPGGGKTALIEAAVTHMNTDDDGEPQPTEDGTDDLLTVLCTPDHTKDSLFLRFVGEGHGDELPNGERSPYTLGPIPYACKYGKKLYLDEYFMLVDGVKPVTYPLMDGRRFLPEGNVDGSPLEIHENFRIVLSSNPLVRGASLPEPVASRCASTTISVETSASMLKDLAIDDSIIAAWEHLGTAGLFQPQIREMRAADYWMSADVNQAVSAFLPEHCPESERKQVRDVVLSYLGGSIREDGRLVVS